MCGLWVRATLPQSCAIALRSPASERSPDLNRYSPDIHLAAPLTTRSNAAQNVYERQRSASGPPSSHSDSSCAEEHITSGVP